jgi:hypothetical protein
MRRSILLGYWVPTPRRSESGCDRTAVARLKRPDRRPTPNQNDRKAGRFLHSGGRPSAGPAGSVPLPRSERSMDTNWRWLPTILLALLLLGCADTEPPANQVTGIRILATSADKPFAKPGESVALSVLAVDGRATRTTPMRIFYVPTLCVNPLRDDVEQCFANIANQYPTRTNLNMQLTEGASATFSLPADILATHPPARGGLPYGIAFGFVIACAGHVERLESTNGFTSAPPFGCFNEQGQLLGKDDYVFAHARMLAYAELRNANPTLDAVSVDGKVLDEKGFTIARCSENDERNCTKVKVDARVPEAAQEPDFSSGPPGSNTREQVWVSYFVTAGKMETDLSVLYDPEDGRLPKTENGLFVKDGSGAHTLFAVVRDNRGGATWRQFPFTIQ